MEGENQNLNTGSKGVFPGEIQSQNSLNTGGNTGAINTKSYYESIEEVPETNTYFKLETKNNEGQVCGVIEIDLVSFRERGQESRYLSIKTIGVGLDGGQSETRNSIDSEIDFKRFKDFISNLNWND